MGHKHYVVGNIASRFSVYLKIKEQILGPDDHFYLVGNTVGLHEGGAEIILDAAKDSRVSLVKGELDHNVGLLYSELNRGEISELWHGCLLFTDEYLLKSYRNKLTTSERETIASVLLEAPSWEEVVVGDKTFALKGGRGNVYQERFGRKGATYQYPRWFHASDELLRFTVHPKAPVPIDGLTIIDGYTPAVLLGSEPGSILCENSYFLMNNAIEGNFASKVAVYCLETEEVTYIE